MLSQSHPKLSPGQLFDETSNSILKVENGHIIVKHLQSGQIQRYSLPSLKFKDQKTSYVSPLKFINKNPNITVNPNGNILTCKSLTFQQVEMNKNFSKETAYWSLYIPQKTPLFSVGIQSKQPKLTYVFDFCINKPTVLTFSLDLQQKSFTCWFNGVQSQFHKPIVIQGDRPWNSFVRVKGSGTSIILNSLTSNPKDQVVNYLNSTSEQTLPAFIEPQIQNYSSDSNINNSQFSLQKISNDKILLIGQNSLKILYRSKKSKQFNFEFVKLGQNENIQVSFSENQFSNLLETSKRLNVSILGIKFNKSTHNSYIVLCTKEQWSKWVTKVLRYLNKVQKDTVKLLKQNKNSILSIQQINESAKIILSKVQSVNPWLNNTQRINSLFSEYNEQFNNTQHLFYFDHIKTNFKIPKQITLNNLAFIKFNSQIVSVKSSSNSYIGCLLKQGNRISILNGDNILFKVIDTVLSRGFAKQSEINQYKKQIEDIQDSDFSKPHIFKILKNCLKYADKIKPPEKLLQELQKKKEVISQKKGVKQQKQKTQTKKPDLDVDKSLLNTLIMMGFGQKSSTKALIQCKNQSLQAAIDLILNKYNQKQLPPVSNKPKRDWQCQVCTLINSKDATVCSVCQTPAPIEATFEEVEILVQNKKQEEKPKQQEQANKQIISQSIEEETIKDFYIWNTQVVYCPVLIAAVFQTKIRFRLLGPNPKFYSNFYTKQNSYFDLTTLKSHQFAHQIDQKQISHMFYLQSSSQQLKRANWGWMNIEDWDFNKENKQITAINLSSAKLTDKHHQFTIQINSQKQSHKLNCKIIVDNVYEQKKRCFVVDQINVSEAQKLIGQKNNILQRKSNLIDDSILLLSLNSHVISNFALQTQVSKQVSNKLASQIISLQSKSTAKHDVIPLIAIIGSFGSQLKYPSVSLQSPSSITINSSKPYKNGIVFKHMHDKNIKISQIKLQQKNKYKVTQVGYAYVLNDLSKQPLIKHQFQFSDLTGKTVVQLNGQKGKYIVIVLYPKQNQAKVHLNHVTVCGQVLDTHEQSLMKLDFLESLVQVNFENQELNTKPLNDLVKINVSQLNYPYDLSSLEQNQQIQLIRKLVESGIRLNIQIKLTLKQKNMRYIKIKSISLNHAKQIKSYTQFTQQKLTQLTQQEYLQYLQSFILTGESKYLEFICKEQNKQFRLLIVNTNLKDFVQKLISCPIDKRQKNKFKLFIQIFGSYLKSNKSLHQLNLNELSIESPHITSYGSQLCFLLSKSIGGTTINNYFSFIESQIKKITQKKQLLQLKGVKYLTDSYSNEKTIFSDLFYRLNSKDKSHNLDESQIHYHYICQKNLNTRKYIVDMMSLYSLDNLELKFEPSKQKSKLVIDISYVSENGKICEHNNYFYEQTFWTQLSNSKAIHSLLFNLNNIKSRYLIINLSFSAVPYSYHKKQEDNIPTNQIIPIVNGEYIGQSEAYLNSKFDINPTNLHLLKKVDNFCKYSLKQTENIFYYNSEEIKQNEKMSMLSLQDLKKKDDTPSNRQSLVNYLMLNPSKDNINFNFVISYLLIDATLECEDLQNARSLNLSEKSIELFVDNFINTQKGVLHEKAIQLLRKIVSLNKQILMKTLKVSFYSEYFFNQVFKDMSIQQNKQILEMIDKQIIRQNFLNNRVFVTNLCWLVNLYTVDFGIIQKLTQVAYQSGYYQKVAIVIHKYGWTGSTKNILLKILSLNMNSPNEQRISKLKLLQLVMMITSSLKDNNELAEVTFEQLKSDNQQSYNIILMQLLNPSRHTKIQHIQKIIYYILNKIQTNLDNDQQYNRQQYFNALNLLNQIGFNHNTVTKILQVFFKLNSQHVYLNQLLASSFLKYINQQEILINTALTQIGSNNLKPHQIRLLNDILVFILNKQVSLETQNISFALKEQTQSIVLNYFSNFLKNILTIGGIQSVKLIDQTLTQKIKIAFYLSTLLQTNKVFSSIKQQNFSSLIRWLMLNITTTDKNTKTPNCSRFLKIQELVWKIIEAKGKSQPQLFAKLYVNIYKQLRQNLTLIQNECVSYNYSRKLDVFNTRVLQRLSNENTFLLNLLKENGLFIQILKQLSNIKTNNLKQNVNSDQVQLVNQLNLYPDSKDKPKDWLIYKNGAKNHVYKIQYSKISQQMYDLTFVIKDDTLVSPSLFTLSKIIFGFKHDLTAQKNVCLPKQINVQGGISLNKMRHIGQMFEIRDDRYINYSVKLFGFNTNTLKNSQNIHTQCNKNLAIKYLRFKIRSPQPVSIQDALSTENVEQKNSVSLVNFLSIQGQLQKNSQPHTGELVRFLELITNVKHKELINVLFNEQSVLEAFKLALLNISFLMKNEKYEKTLHNFLMRICQQNTSIGNEMIEKYLQLQNSDLCAKISAQIVLSNDKQIGTRATVYFNFISKVLLQNKSYIDDITPFLNRFTQITFYAITRNKYDQASIISDIKLTISPQIVKSLLRQIQVKSKSQQTLLIISKFIRTIVTLSSPFIILGIQLKSVLQQLYQRKNKFYDEILGSLIIDHKQSRSWFMENKYFEQTFQQTFNLIKTTQQTQKVNSNIQFLTILSFNSNIKQLINKYQYNLMLFEMLMSKNYQTVLSNSNNQNLRKNFVDLIARTSLGSENQTLIASLLKDSIPNIISQGNQKFVGQIFLPLLNSYEKITLCILPFSKAQNKLVTDISNTEVNMNSTDIKQIPVEAASKQPSFRLPSTLTTEEFKNRIFEQLKKSSYQTGIFNLAINHGTYTTGLTQSFKTKVFNNSQPFLIVFKTKLPNVDAKFQTLCIFCNRTKKTQLTEKTINWSKGSFILLLDESQNNKFTLIDTQPTGSKNLISMAQSNFQDSESDDTEQQMLTCQYNAKTFAEISFSYNDSNYFEFKTLSNSLLSQSDSYLQSAQYWLFSSSTDPSGNATLIKQQSPISTLTKSLLSSNYDRSLFNSQHLSNLSINTLRYEKVYEFPSSITVSQLKQSLRIINCSFDEKKLKQLQLTLLGSKQTFTEEITLQEIKKKQGNKDMILLDINMNFDNLLSLMNLKQQLKKEEVDFLPKKGILKYFEENDGIQAMIKVIKKSIEGWKNKARMQKWLQYVTELENFSHFPHFFAIYLKDKQTFRLLFNLLAGLPDKQTDTKWDELQSSSSQKLLRIVSQILHMDKTPQFREYALKNNFFITIIQRLRILTGMFKRKFDKDYKDEQEDLSPSKNPVDDDGTKKIKKKKGVGYGNDQSSNTKWMKGDNMQIKKKQFEVIEIILNIIENFLDIRHWKIPDSLLQNIYESALLPFIEDGLRAGTLLQISKHPQKFKVIFKIIKTFSKHESLVPVLLPIGNNYQPRQTESIQSLLKSLENIASIFLSCLNQNKTTQTKEQQQSQELANLIKQTYVQVQEAIEQYKQNHMNDQTQQKALQEILQLPLDKKYRTLMKDLRFDYIDMKQTPNKIKHHYASNFNPTYTPNQHKMIRLAQQLADISTALPFQHTNGVYVRCDKDRVDFMQALIMGSNGTPYGHGAFLFDVYFDDNYPNNPPKINLTTTGHGKVRFNPNLYACGKVCLSLLGTWRGSASENWDAKVSTLLQVLLSIQAIIMSQEVYFNEPGFQNEQGTEEGEKKNQAYSNIVRYCNIKFSMIDNIRNPPKGFETVIRRHFYLKKDQIMEECRKWQKYAQKRPANYIGLVNDHNHSWSNEFKKTKTIYKEMLDQAIKQLEEQLNKLTPPKITDIITTKQTKKQKKKKVVGNKMQELEKQQQLQQIDVSYDKNKISEAKEIDITDEKVKDRWSRYIGAMGIDAVSKQSKADIMVFGLNPLALEVVKNLVLSGCRKLTICDDEVVKPQDLAGGFFYTQEDIGKKRIQSILYKIRELNVYVKIDTIQFKKVTPQVLKTYSLVLTTEISLYDQIKMSNICRQHKVKFISADSIGFTCRIVNDLGQKFEVLDKNGEEPVEVFVKQITTSEKGVVTLLDGVKNPFEDGQAVLIRNVEGMKLKDQQSKSINSTIHKVKVINSKSFEIGNTIGYTPYIRNGTIKNIKTPVQLSYKPFSEVVLDGKNILVDENLAFYDFSKIQNSKLVKFCYLTLQQFRKQNQNKYPEAWSIKDLNKFVEIFKTFYVDNVEESTLQFVQKFALTSKGYLPPLCAFFGGLVCQQIIKAITKKFKPILSQFYIQFSEIVPDIPAQINQQSLDQIFTQKNLRDVGFETVIGNALLQTIKDSKLFMIGSGAIGCELLKNFAMIGFGTGQKGKITLTDPDHIQNSNLNRQFLFRQKHISKSKSRTASEAVKIMNPALKNHIVALTERVSDSTKDIFTNKFFEGLTLVANALDNVAARRYVDQRCVQNKAPLFESGTLGPKGHVQVIIPYLTQSYGSQNDPVQEGEIPHCTLKMFPEQTLHCIEWARDIFGKKFSLQPKALIKIIDKGYKPEKDDIKALNESVTMVKKGPKTFEDCINYAIHTFYKYYRDDVMQLLYTYPLDAKTKNGEPFWKLPKRPPTPIKLFDPENILQCTFVISLAVMLAKIYQIQYPKNFRSQIERLNIGKAATKIKIADFVPSDEKAKQILKQSSEKKQQNTEQQKTEVLQQKDETQLYKEIITTGGHQFKIKSEEFQKDDDANGHIDFIYSMANLRAINYKLDQMDWINVKIKAGRIVPALATTTACVSGLQTLQICKYLKKIKIDKMKNSYLNLAVPSIQMSQPGEVLKKKINENLTVNLWDRWEFDCQKSSTFADLYEKLAKKYEIFPVGVLQGMSRIDTGKSEQDKKLFLKEKILDKLDLDQNYIDIIVLFTKSPQDDKIIEGVPPVRLLFN